MTLGSSILKNFSWPLNSKKRHRSGSGGSKEFEARKTNIPVLQQRKSSGNKDESRGGSLEVLAPSSSVIQFKYSWPLERFVKQIKTCKADGINSKLFEINLNGILTVWNLSIRFWVGGRGERLTNPVVLCLNLVTCRATTKQDAAVKYKFGILNQDTQEFEMGGQDKAMIIMQEMDKLQSVGYKNIVINDQNINSCGDVTLSVQMTITLENKEVRSLSSDLGSLIDDVDSSDLILAAGDREFRVHRNILAARSPVFAQILSKNDGELKLSEKENVTIPVACHSILEETDAEIAQTKVEDEKSDETKIVDNKSGEQPEISESNDCDKNLVESDTEKEELMKAVLITEYPPETIESLLLYIYTDRTHNINHLPHSLLAAAEYYQLPGLKLQCENHLCENICPLNVGDMLLLSDQYKCETLKKTSLDYCVENHSYIMKNSSWSKMEETNPELFAEAIACVAAEICEKHVECIEKGSNRYNTEKEIKET